MERRSDGSSWVGLQVNRPILFHTYDRACECRCCWDETKLRRSKWKDVLDLCKRHNGIDEKGKPCEICIDMTSGVLSEDPMLHALGVLMSKTLKESFT